MFSLYNNRFDLRLLRVLCYIKNYRNHPNIGVFPFLSSLKLDIYINCYISTRICQYNIISYNILMSREINQGFTTIIIAINCTVGRYNNIEILYK